MVGHTAGISVHVLVYTSYVVSFHVIIRGKSFGLGVCVRPDVYLEVFASDIGSH